jgi:hypothetical protein
VLRNFRSRGLFGRVSVPVEGVQLLDEVRIVFGDTRLGEHPLAHFANHLLNAIDRDMIRENLAQWGEVDMGVGYGDENEILDVGYELLASG